MLTDISEDASNHTEKTEKVPLLLIPGLLCNERLWAHQIHGLQDIAEIRVADTLQDDSIVDMATRQIDRMQRDFAGQPFAIAGLSMGGYIGLEILRQTDQVQKLALLDTCASAETERSKKARQKLMAVVRAHERFIGMSDDQLPRYIHPDRIHDQALVDEIRRMTLEVGKDAYLRQQQAIIQRQSAEEILPNIHIPSLVICGAQDVLTPVAEQETMVDRMPNATLHVIPDCGHLSTMERGDTVTTLLKDWILS